MAYELIVIYTDGTKETAYYSTPERAQECENGFKTAFGNQIAFTCINEKDNVPNGAQLID